MCQSRNWQSLANLVGDFLIIYCDFSSKELFVLTDQTGKFPCFFSLANNRLVLSTNFAMVQEALSSCSLNINAVFDFIAWSLLPTDETILSEVHQVPPGTLLKINPDFSYSLTSMIDLEKFLAQPYKQYSHIEEFTNDFLTLLKELTTEQLEVLGNLQFAADISSGFDSSLVCYLLKKLAKDLFTCYCGVSRHTLEDTDPLIVKEFASKHNLVLKFINQDYYYAFSTNQDRDWAVKFPNQAFVGLLYDYHLKIAKDKNQVVFKGEGGDEIYRAYLMEQTALFPAQEEYFQVVRKLKLHIDQVLSKKGIEVFLVRERFQKKRVYSTILPTSTIFANSSLSHICWAAGLWFLTPFADPRLTQFARGLPHKGIKAPTKQEVWMQLKDIFVLSQFRPKGGPEEHGKLLLKKDPDFVIGVLKDSILAQKGWVRAFEIIKDIQEGNIQKYFAGDAMIFLCNVLKLEYFLQHNNVRTPNT